MNSLVAGIFTFFVAGAVVAPSLKASTVTFTYTAPDVGTTVVSGTGSFSYNGSLTTITLGDLTAFSFQLDLATPGALVDPAIFDFALTPDLLSFSATVSGGVVTALSLATDFEAADNTSNFNETQKNLIVNNLGTNGADNQTDETDLTEIVPYDTGTITTEGPGNSPVPVPEPSTVLVMGAAALLLVLKRRKARTPQA